MPSGSARSTATRRSRRSWTPTQKGWELALEQVNAAGGINGRKLEIISRDDGATPGDAVRVAEELLSREKVDLLAGGFLSHIGLALTDFAKQKKVFFLASEPLTDKIVWQNGNRYTFRLRLLHLHADGDAGARGGQGARRSAGRIVYPNYEYGQSAAATFKEQLKKLQPDVEFVGEQAPPLGKIDAGAVAQALADLQARRASSTCCSGPISPSSSGRATPAACSRTGRCSAC